MRHRIKSGKLGSFSPETGKKVHERDEALEGQEIDKEVKEIFEEDTSYKNDDEAYAALEFYDTPDDQE